MYKLEFRKNHRISILKLKADLDTFLAGLLAGHVGQDDSCNLTLKKLMINALLRKESPF